MCFVSTLITGTQHEKPSGPWAAAVKAGGEAGEIVFLCLPVVIQSLSHVRLLVTPWTEHARLPCPPLSPRVCSNSYPMSR